VVRCSAARCSAVQRRPSAAQRSAPMAARRACAWAGPAGGLACTANFFPSCPIFWRLADTQTHARALAHPTSQRRLPHSIARRRRSYHTSRAIATPLRQPAAAHPGAPAALVQHKRRDGCLHSQRDQRRLRALQGQGQEAAQGRRGPVHGPRRRRRAEAQEIHRKRTASAAPTSKLILRRNSRMP
jgi:hypothetical protein